MQLSRFNISDGSTVPSVLQSRVATGLQGQPAGIAVDGQSRVWLAWDKTLAMYDPNSGMTSIWALPPVSPTQVSPSSDPQLDGLAVALTVAPDGEVWVAARSDKVLFGFTPGVQSWDRLIPLPVVPLEKAHLDNPRAGVLTVSGLSGTHKFLALVDTTTNTATQLSPSMLSYSILDSNHVVILDENLALARVGFSVSQPEPLASGAPVQDGSQLVTDGAGNVWFQLPGRNTPRPGIGKLTLASSAITTYPFPLVPLAKPPVIPCPQGCNLGGAGGVVDPGVQDIVVDAHNDVWVIDREPGSGYDQVERNLYGAAVPSSLYELLAGS